MINALRWHLTGFDATNRGEDADGAREHGWSTTEQKQIDGILGDLVQLKAVLLAWIAADRAKPASRQNARNRDDLMQRLRSDFFKRIGAGGAFAPVDLMPVSAHKGEEKRAKLGESHDRCTVRQHFVRRA